MKIDGEEKKSGNHGLGSSTGIGGIALGGKSNLQNGIEKRKTHENKLHDSSVKNSHRSQQSNRHGGGTGGAIGN